RSLVSLYDFENRDAIFPGVHRSYKFCLLTITGLSRLTTRYASFAFFAQNVGDLQDEQRRFTLSASDIRLLNPNTRTCPIFRSKRDMLITKAIYEHFPVLIKEGSIEENPWDITFRQGLFNMTSDSHLFRTRKQLEGDGWQLEGNVFKHGGEQYLPLYEGKMIWHYDHRFSSYDNAAQEFHDVPAEQHDKPNQLPLTRYWVHESHMSDIRKSGRNALLAFRDIARSTDARSAIFSIIPVVPCGHTLPLTLANPAYHVKQIFLAVSLSSFVFDYISRQKLGGTHMTFFIFKQLPVLPPDHYTTQCVWDIEHTLGDWITPRALELTYTAWDLEAFARDCGYAGPPFRWDGERRFVLRCELDAAYFHLYGIAREDVAYIMETFRVWREKEVKQQGEYRTKRVILEIYDEMAQAMEHGAAYRTRLEPGLADAAVAHTARVNVEVRGA
ncbi:MAG: Eco57I restriction-modification methylase domain-containing protein, partial [Ktedonobacteraceae bacterium]